MTELRLSAGKCVANTASGGRQQSSRERLKQQNRQDIAEFRERMLRLADSLVGWLDGYDVDITLREISPVNTAGAYTIPGIVLCHRRNWAGFTPQALYSEKGGGQLKGEVCLAVDNPGRRPRTEKYMLGMAGHPLSAADWIIYKDSRTPGKGKELTRKQLLAAVESLFDDTE